MSVGSVPQSVSEVLLSFHFMPVLAARAVATRSSRSAWAMGLSSNDVRTIEPNSFSTVAAKFFRGLLACSNESDQCLGPIRLDGHKTLPLLP